MLEARTGSRRSSSKKRRLWGWPRRFLALGLCLIFPTLPLPKPFDGLTKPVRGFLSEALGLKGTPSRSLTGSRRASSVEVGQARGRLELLYNRLRARPPAGGSQKSASAPGPRRVPGAKVAASKKALEKKRRSGAIEPAAAAPKQDLIVDAHLNLSLRRKP
jgi:hypothetical protein